eukprot:2328579-Ditylum_brightwellii.AAC.1
MDVPASSTADKESSEDEMKVTMPESCKDNTVQMETSPAVLDSGIVPSVDASTQQTSSSTTVE